MAGHPEVLNWRTEVGSNTIDLGFLKLGNAIIFGKKKPCSYKECGYFCIPVNISATSFGIKTPPGEYVVNKHRPDSTHWVEQ